MIITSYGWLIAMVVFFIIEAMVSGLISVWCGVAAAFTAIFAYFVDDIIYQGYFFVILSVILFILTRRLSKKIMSRRKKGDGEVDRITGRVVEIKGITEKGFYRIYLDGKEWLAISNKSYSIGDKAQVIGIEGIKLVLSDVKKVEID